jgi:hypothetical protein
MACLSCLQERISFNPHPKTLTMAGDYEYFAAQGYHPLAFALAELIDNALRATKGNKQRPRSITVSLITDDKGSAGVICVSDNGSGMNTQELNNWAVMNLSMEDRGLLNTDDAKGESTYSTAQHDMINGGQEIFFRYWWFWGEILCASASALAHGPAVVRPGV